MYICLYVLHLIEQRLGFKSNLSTYIYIFFMHIYLLCLHVYICMAPLSHTLPLLRRQSVGCGTNGCGVIAMDVVRSHGGSRASSPGAGSTKSPKARVGTYELEGIPLAWDNEPTIRERVREKKNLCLSHDFETGRSESDFCRCDSTQPEVERTCAKTTGCDDESPWAAATSNRSADRCRAGVL